MRLRAYGQPVSKDFARNSSCPVGSAGIVPCGCAPTSMTLSTVKMKRMMLTETRDGFGSGLRGTR